jgi:hypothetical protein
MNLHDQARVLNDAFCLKPIGSHTQLTQCSVATTLSPPVGATKLLIQASGSVDVRYTLDTATAPTASKGFVIVHDDPPIVIPVYDGVVVKLLEESANAVLDYQWAGLPA